MDYREQLSAAWRLTLLLVVLGRPACECGWPLRWWRTRAASSGLFWNSLYRRVRHSGTALLKSFFRDANHSRGGILGLATGVSVTVVAIL